jgi:hypothetical protein
VRRLAILVLALPFLALFPILVLASVAAGWTQVSVTAQRSAPGTAQGHGLPPAPGAGPSPEALAAVPPAMLALYRAAAKTCPGLAWSVLAGIGTVESSNGTSTLPGVRSGANFAGAEGPMQFEPATFAAYAYPVPPGGVSPPSPYDPVDAVYAAARDLCANGGGTRAGLPGAVLAYNHAQWYVDEVLALAGEYSSAEYSSASGRSA